MYTPTSMELQNNMTPEEISLWKQAVIEIIRSTANNDNYSIKPRQDTLFEYADDVIKALRERVIKQAPGDPFRTAVE